MNTSLPTTTSVGNPANRAPIPFRDDLRLRVGECALIKLALEAVAALAPELPAWRSPADGSYNPRMLLTLLTYSYAAGSYASEDIELDCQQDTATRYIAANVHVHRDTLRAFRRANRPWIEVCLAWVLEHAGDTSAAPVLGEQQASPRLGTQPDSTFLIQARRRVELAILLDMALAD
ncbi:MAG TPA: hypothetical protein VI136_21505 [Verrucomicrobiae bacterium]